MLGIYTFKPHTDTTPLVMAVCVSHAVSSISVTILTENVRESDGVIENFITITKEGESEIPLDFSIIVKSGTATNGMCRNQCMRHSHGMAQ